MATVLLVACHKISHIWAGRSEATGGYDDQGNLIMKFRDDSIMPGTVFEIDDAHPELERLRELGAVRDPDEGEAAIWERTK